LEASTCAVIFFGGDWKDAGVAAICGFCSGLVEWFSTSKYAKAEAKALIDVLVGATTGFIAGYSIGFKKEGKSTVSQLSSLERSTGEHVVHYIRFVDGRRDH